jgi:hypothetical protein
VADALESALVVLKILLTAQEGGQEIGVPPVLLDKERARVREQESKTSAEGIPLYWSVGPRPGAVDAGRLLGEIYGRIRGMWS